MVVVVLALVGAVVLALARGGRFGHLGRLPLRDGWLVVVAVLLQLAGALIPLTAAYPEGLILSAVLAGIFLARNRRLPGVGLVALGLGLNAVAVLANGGVMPVDLQAFARVGGDTGALLHDPRHAPATVDTRVRLLTDVIPAPLPLGLGQVLSPGDVGVATGCALIVYVGVRGAWDDGAMAKKGRKKRARKGNKANHGKKPNC